MERLPIDIYDEFPEDMLKYLRNYGWHFNHKLCDYAVSLLRRKGDDGKPVHVDPMSKSDVEELLKRCNVKLDNTDNYDFVYVANMSKAILYGSSIADEIHASQYVKDVTENPNCSDGDIMRCWYAKIVGSGHHVDWYDFV